jgi:hypothetical protein
MARRHPRLKVKTGWGAQHALVAIPGGNLLRVHVEGRMHACKGKTGWGAQHALVAISYQCTWKDACMRAKGRPVGELSMRWCDRRC